VKNLAKGANGVLTYLTAYLVTAIVSIIMYTKVFLNQSLFNTSATAPEYSITSVVVPMVGVAIAVGLTLGAVFLIIHFVKGGGSAGR
jgi:hypothetical protein